MFPASKRFINFQSSFRMVEAIEQKQLKHCVSSQEHNTGEGNLDHALGRNIEGAHTGVPSCRKRRPTSTH